ncbi:hypothetical protein D3C81_1914630 [compost metagenome]
MACATGRKNATVSRTSVARSKRISSMLIWPDSTFEKSRMSLMMPSNVDDDDDTVCSCCSCASDSGVRSSNSRLPRMVLSGVRISWLMVARNTDFA